MSKNQYPSLSDDALTVEIRSIKRALQELKSGIGVGAVNAISPNGAVSLQQAVNNISSLGGGSVLLKNGTYLLSSSVTVPNNVTIQGETGGGVVIDFQNKANQILVSGTLFSSKGTCSVNNRATTVVGVGTTWDNTFIGQSILLKGRWFQITAVTDTTHLTISQPFDADNVSGQANVIATTVSGITLINFTVQNSTHPNGGVYYAYAQSCLYNNVTVLNCTIGANFLACFNQSTLNFFTSGCGIGCQVVNSAVWTLYNFECYGSTSTNLLCTNFYNVSVSDATISSAVGDNVLMTNCSSWGFYDVENTTAGLNGIEMVSCTDIEIFSMAIRDAANDGIKLTSGCQRVGVASNCSLINNTHYGINIADNTSDRTTIMGNFFSGNGSGTVNNLGTNTINVNNQS